jgi:protein-S-isoprenylcysteine O-methyltransferase Ste14
MMRKSSAALGSAFFFLLAPATVAGFIPYWITGWRMAEPASYGMALRGLGASLILVAVVALVHAFTRFVVEGLGTPAPIAPTDRLVVGGLYRHVRNPMYLAVLLSVIGQALLFGQRSLLIYAAMLGAAFVSFVRAYEEPTLTSQFGSEYEAYRRAVPGWWPRLSPWRPETPRPSDRDRALKQ